MFPWRRAVKRAGTHAACLAVAVALVAAEVLLAAVVDVLLVFVGVAVAVSAAADATHRICICGLWLFAGVVGFFSRVRFCFGTDAASLLSMSAN